MQSLKPQSGRQSKTGLRLVCNVRSKCTHKSRVVTTKHTCKMWNEGPSLNVDLASVNLSVWAAILVTLHYANPHLTHIQSSLNSFSPVKDRQRMCLWSAKTHISSLRFHIPGIPSEDYCSPFKTVPHMEGGKKRPRAGKQERRLGRSLHFEGSFPFTVLLYLSAVLPFCSTLNEKTLNSYHDRAPVSMLCCENWKLYSFTVNLKKTWLWFAEHHQIYLHCHENMMGMRCWEFGSCINPSMQVTHKVLQMSPAQ